MIGFNRSNLFQNYSMATKAALHAVYVCQLHSYQQHGNKDIEDYGIDLAMLDSCEEPELIYGM